MSENEDNIYFRSFHDDAADASNGYDALCCHMKESLEATRNLVRYVEYKLAFEEESHKQIKRIHEKIKKNDSSLPLIKVVTDAFTSESEMVLTAIADFKTGSVEPFKEKIKECLANFEGLKSDSKFELKKRISAYDEAVKACKAFGLKYRESYLFKKKIATVDQNEKMKTKIYKIDAGVASAEKFATVSLELLKKSLQDWKKCFADLSSKCLEMDTQMLVESKNFVVEYQMHSCKINSQITSIYGRVVEFDSSVDVESYYKNIARDKGTHKEFLPFACINQYGIDDKTEFTVGFCETDCPVLKKIEGSDGIELAKQTVSNSNFYNTKKSFSPKSETSNKEDHKISFRESEGAQERPTMESNLKLVGTFCLAKYDYKKSNDDELEFKKGDIIEITGVEDEDWLVGKIGKSTGAFPFKFTEPTAPPT